MQHFREWAVRVASADHDPDWIMPEFGEGGQRFAFSLEAYNHFAEHSGVGLKGVRDEEELHSLLKRHAKHLYKGESAIRLKDSNFFVLPNRIVALNFKRNK